MREDEDIFKYRAALLVRSKTIDLSPIRDALELNPQPYWLAGDMMVRPTNKRSVREDNYSCFPFPIDPLLTLEENVGIYITKLVPISLIIDKILHDGGSAVVAISWYSGQGRGYEFHFSLLQKLAELRINLGVEVF